MTSYHYQHLPESKIQYLFSFQICGVEQQEEEGSFPRVNTRIHTFCRLLRRNFKIAEQQLSFCCLRVVTSDITDAERANVPAQTLLEAYNSQGLKNIEKRLILSVCVCACRSSV